MRQRDPSIALGQMLQACLRLLDITKGRSREDLDSDELLDLAVVRLLEILGEAANRVPPELQSRYPRIPWREIVGLRNRLIHGYDSVDLDIVWQVVVGDIPALTEALSEIVPPGSTVGDDI